MKKITLLCFAFTAFLFNANAQDTCGTAVAVTPGTVTGTTIVDATAGGEGDTVTQRDASWFAYTATEDGTMDLSSCNGGADTRVYVFDTCGGTAIGTNDDSCDLGDGNAWASELSLPVTNGTTYYIEWDDRWSLGPFDWSLTFTPLPPAPPLCASTPTPADAAMDVVNLGDQVTLSWVLDTTGEPATTYNLWFGEVGAVADLGNFPAAETINVTGTTYATTYNWYIVPANAAGPAVGCDATVWSFTTEDAPPPPSNDTCATADPVVCGTPVSGDTSDPTATDTGGNAAADLWYVYDNAGVVEDVTLSLCGSGYDTLIRVYADCPATTQIASNDDFCDGTRSQVTFTNDGTQAYYVMVEGYASNTGTFTLTATCDVSIAAPANDNCDASEALTIGVPATGTTAGATDQGTGPDDDTVCDPFDFHADVWYSVTLTGGPNDLTVTTTIPGGSTSTEAGLAVYGGTECDFLQTNELGCAGGDSTTGGTLTLPGLADGTYYVRVWSDGVAARIEGTFDIVADATLSTQDFDNGLAFSYYPNPVNDNLALTAQKDIQNVSVYNMLGQEVVRTAPNAVNTEVNMSALQSGAYFVKVTIDNVTETVRVLKN